VPLCFRVKVDRDDPRGARPRVEYHTQSPVSMLFDPTGVSTQDHPNHVRPAPALAQAKEAECCVQRLRPWHAGLDRNASSCGP
jgi:hypothetical protein